MALLILALLQRIFLMSSLMLLLVWLIFFMVLIKLLPILGTISRNRIKLMVLDLICLRNDRQDCFFFQAEDGIRDYKVTGVQTCALPICNATPSEDESPEDEAMLEKLKEMYEKLSC